MRRRVFMNLGGGPDPEYEEFYRKCHCSPQEAMDFLLPLALYLTGNIHDAEDLVHDLPLKFLIWPGSTEPVRNFKPFLRTSLARLFIDRILRANTPIPIENIPDLASTDPSPDDQAISNVILQNFWNEVSALNEIHREVVRLKFCYTLSIQRTHPQIATELSIPVGTADHPSLAIDPKQVGAEIDNLVHILHLAGDVAVDIPLHIGIVSSGSEISPDRAGEIAVELRSILREFQRSSPFLRTEWRSALRAFDTLHHRVTTRLIKTLTRGPVSWASARRPWQ